MKPSNDGSSIGVTKVTIPEQLPEAFQKAARYDHNVMIEPWIDGKEYTVGILGTNPLPVIEIKTPRTFYDYDAKYNKQRLNIFVPVTLPPEKERELQELAFRAFLVTGL